MLLYEQGWQYGKRAADIIEKVPRLRAMHPIKALQAIDTAIQGGIQRAPAIGAGIGAGLGLLEEKVKHPRRKVSAKDFALAGLEGGVKGGLIGVGVRKFGPHVPGPEHLHKIRTEYLDRLVGGNTTRVERFFDRSAKPIMRPLREHMPPLPRPSGPG
jgi:hypothetical protein